MPRAKVSAEPVLRDWNEVDEALREIGMIGRQVAFAEARMNERIDALKAKYDEQVAPALARKLRLEKDLEEFCAANKGEFGRVRTKALTFGEVSFRLVRSLKPLSRWTLAKIADALQARKLDRFLHVRITPDKEALTAAALAGEDISQYGARLVETDEFGYKIDEQKLDEQR